jgi:hypothetical protein
MALNYSTLQSTVISTLTNLGAINVTITCLPDPTTSAAVTMKTIGVFDSGLVKNIDNRQNPTVIGGQTLQVVYVPGNLAQDPDIGGQISYKVNGKQYVKRISAVNTTQPTDTVLMYILTLE